MYEIWHDGIVWCGRKRGFPGIVFGDNQDQILSRCKTSEWKHRTQGNK
jgi:hypothetical protein